MTTCIFRIVGASSKLPHHSTLRAANRGRPFSSFHSEPKARLVSELLVIEAIRTIQTLRIFSFTRDPDQVIGEW